MENLGILIDPLELTPFNKIPASFIRKTLTDHQKEYIQIKFFIKEAIDNWDGTKLSLYDKLADEIPMSIHTITKLGGQL